jgi:4'-phosphopantetheinyl transferase
MLQGCEGEVSGRLIPDAKISAMDTDPSPTTSDSIWISPPAKPVLARNEVHLWRTTVEVPALDFTRIQRLLSSDERAKAAAFFFERDHHRFVVARGFLRAILSLYLNCTPTELHFKYTEYGKPSLASPHVNANLNFNLAHSGDLALYGITLQRAIGIDIEQIRHEFASEEIARHFFSVNEASRLLSIPAHDRPKAFFECWTRKEAFIKAKGIGLSLPLDQFDVSVSSNEPAMLLETRWDKNERSRWSLRAIDVGPDYAATVAVEGHDWQASYWQASRDIFGLG